MSYSSLKKVASQMDVHVSKVRGKIRLEEDRYRLYSFGYAANCHDLAMAERYLAFYEREGRFPNSKCER